MSDQESTGPNNYQTDKNEEQIKILSKLETGYK